jgi:hypothetical protein
VIQVGGQVRLALEVVFFAIAVGGLWAAGRPDWAAILIVLLLVNYGIDHRRTLDLLLGRR